jgi:hypothetical protein
MTTEVKEFTTVVFAKLDFSNPQNIRERVTVALITALGELATWDKDYKTSWLLYLKPKPDPLKKTWSFKGAPFTGKKDSLDVMEFVQQVKLFVDMNNYTSTQHKKVLLLGLCGTAHKTVTNWLKEPTHAVVLAMEIETFLKTCFEDSIKSNKTDRWIQMIQQHGLVRQFNQIFQEKLSQIKSA